MPLEDFADELIHGKGRITNLSRDDADGALELLEGIIPVLEKNDSFPIVDFKFKFKSPYYLYMVGDLHGDLPTAINLIRRMERINRELSDSTEGRNLRSLGMKLLFLGNYIDRVPKKVANGGIRTLLYILAAKALFPEDVFLLRGNREAYDIVEFPNHSLPQEIFDLFGEEASKPVQQHVEDIFSYLPIFARTPTGVIASHGGFPLGRTKPIPLIRKEDTDLIIPALWGSPKEIEAGRGEVSSRCDFDESYLDIFLNEVGCRVFIRSHDRALSGYSMYDGKMLTVCTSRKYARHGAGGMLLARTLIHPDKMVTGMRDITLLEIEGSRLDKVPITVWTPD